MLVKKAKFGRGEHVVVPLIYNKKVANREGIIIDSYYNEKEEVWRYIVKCSPHPLTQCWNRYEKKEYQINKKEKL